MIQSLTEEKIIWRDLWSMGDEMRCLIELFDVGFDLHHAFYHTCSLHDRKVVLGRKYRGHLRIAALQSWFPEIFEQNNALLANKVSCQDDFTPAGWLAAFNSSLGHTQNDYLVLHSNMRQLGRAFYHVDCGHWVLQAKGYCLLLSNTLWAALKRYHSNMQVSPFPR